MTPVEIVVADPYRPLLLWDWQERYMLLTGGRGSAKSFSLALAVVCRMAEPGWRILYTRYTMSSAEDSVIPEFLGHCQRIGRAGEFQQVGSNVRHRITGSEILFRGIKTSSGNQTAKLKSLTGINCWILEEAEECVDKQEFNTIDLSVRDMRHPPKVILALNPGHISHWIYKRWWQPFNLPEGFSGSSPSGAFHIHTTYEDNAPNLPAELIAEAKREKDADPDEYRHVHLGHWARDKEGAVWKREWIEDHRVSADAVPDLRRIVIAVDPSATSGAKADEAGIVGVGSGVDGRFYVLEDNSRKDTPLGWARKAVDAYHDNGADRIIYEANQGGEMVAAVIRQADPSVPLSSVYASRGKRARAEPVAALYERGLVSHVNGGLSKLEGELLSWTGDKDASPNRLDALVWALSELAGLGKGGAGAAGGNRWAGMARRGVM